MVKALSAKPVGTSARDQNTSRTERHENRRVTLSLPVFCDDPANTEALAKVGRAAKIAKVRVTVTETDADTEKKAVSRAQKAFADIFGKAKIAGGKAKRSGRVKRAVNRVAAQLTAIAGNGSGN